MDHTLKESKLLLQRNHITQLDPKLTASNELNAHCTVYYLERV